VILRTPKQAASLILRSPNYTSGIQLFGIASTNHGNPTIKQFIRELKSYYKNTLSTIGSQIQSEQWKPLVDIVTQIVDY